MKKIISILLFCFLFIGCSKANLLNTPTKKVEMFFSKYQSLDDDVVEQIKKVADDDLSLTDEQRNEYIEIMKRHYQSLKYDIKDETIDGDNATVTVAIEVIDYSRILDNANTYLNENEDEFKTNDEYDKKLYNDYRIEELKKASDTVKYTIDITLTKIDGEWVIDDIPNDVEDKIQGVYYY